MLTWVRDNLKDLKPKNFYKRFSYSHTSRKQAEEKLRELLTAIKNDNNIINRKKANCLLDSFESWTQSIDCEKYWLDVETSLGRLAHEVTGRISAYNTIKNFTRKINDEEESLNEFQPPSKRVKNDESEDYSDPESGTDDNDDDSDYVYSPESLSCDETKVTKSARKLNSDEETPSVSPTKRDKLLQCDNEGSYGQGFSDSENHYSTCSTSDHEGVNLRTVGHTQNADDDNKPSPLYNSAESHKDASDDLEEIDTEIGATQDEEVRNLTGDEVQIRNKLLDVLLAHKNKEKQSGKDFMSSIPLNNIIDLTDKETHEAIKSIFNDDQLEWLSGVLQKKIWDQSDEFKHYINQFTEDKRSRFHIPTLVRKTFISGRFDSIFHEAHDIAQHIMIHCSIRLEAPVTRESDFFHLERTYSVDTVVYILNRLFRMHNDVLDGGWIELTTPNTKSHKIDGIFKAIKMKRKNEAIIIIECSKGPKTPDPKKYDDYVKLCRNSMRLLNKVLEYVPRNYARIYLVQCAGGYIDIKYLVRPLPSVYLLNRFLHIKIPVTFNDFEDFSKGIIDFMNWQTDVLLTVKKINKACETKNDGIHVIPIQDTPQKDKTRSKTKKATNDDNPPSPFPGLPCSELPTI